MVETRRLTPNNDLINAKFEGYKLVPFSEEQCLRRTRLPDEGLTIGKIGENHRMGFRELQARIRFSHLAAGYPLNATVGTAFYVDNEYNVMRVLYDSVSMMGEGNYAR